MESGFLPAHQRAVSCLGAENVPAVHHPTEQHPEPDTVIDVLQVLLKRLHGDLGQLRPKGHPAPQGLC
jgi:hypothetical protein